MFSTLYSLNFINWGSTSFELKKVKMGKGQNYENQNVKNQIITTSKRVDHYYENHNVEKRTSKVKKPLLTL
jgi:hypothetical protein